VRHYRVFVTGKPGIFDPAGKAAEDALVKLGYTGVSGLRIGKLIDLECADGVGLSEVQEMCERFLANPVIEGFTVSEVGLGAGADLVAEAGATAGAGLVAEADLATEAGSTAEAGRSDEAGAQ